MVSYRLYYFPMRVRAEMIRMIFAVANYPFEDIRVPMNEWESLKNTMPNGSLPVLIVDNKKMSESMAIARYLGREFNLYGSNSGEAYEIDRIIDMYSDYLQGFFQAGIPQAVSKTGMDSEELRAAVGKYFEITVEKALPTISALLAANTSNSGHFVATSLTIADLQIYDYLFTLRYHFPNYIQKFQNLIHFMNKMENHPRLQKYLKERPFTPF
ncbi:hypothetical protein SNEBB_003003 [Seison nebaliae]|nr:hypothetical protein SNEBB_003003 [Seison nebaliae]